MTTSGGSSSSESQPPGSGLGPASQFAGLSARSAAMPDQLAELSAELREARRAYEAGDVQVAVEHARHVLGPPDAEATAGTGPGFVRVRCAAQILLGSALDAQGEADQAREAFRKAVDAVDTGRVNGPTVEDAELGVALQFLGREPEAIERLERALDHGAREPDVLRALAVALLSGGSDAPSLERAEELLREAGQLAPWDARIGFGLTSVLAAQGRTQEAADQATALGFALGQAERLREADVALDAAIRLGEPDRSAMALLGKAEIRRHFGDFDEAAQLVQDALELDSDDPVAHGLDGSIRLSRGDAAGAIEPLELAIRLAPGDMNILSNYALALHSLGRIEDARHALDDAQAAAGEEVAQLVLQDGQLMLDEHRPELALERFARVIELAPSQSSAHVGQGEALRQLGRNPEALEALDRGMALGADTAYAHGTRGQVLSALGRFDEAIEALEAANRQDAGRDWVHAALGTALWSRDRLDEAYEAFEQALELQPNNVDALVGKGVLLRGKGNSEEALECLDRALELDATNPYAQMRRGQTLYTLTRYEEAATALQRAIDLYANAAGGPGPVTEHAEALAWHGETLRLMGTPPAALESLDASIGLVPRNGWALGTRGQVLASVGRIDEAIDDLRGAAKETPELAWVWDELGNALRRAGRPAEAVDAFEDGARHGLDPFSSLAGHVTALQDAGRPDDALARVEAVLADHPNDAFVLSTKASVLGGVGQWDQCVEWAGRAIEADKDYDWAYLVRGWAHRNRGSKFRAAAREDFESAAKLDPDYAEYRQKLGDVIAVMDGHDAARPHFEWVLENSTAAAEGDAFGILVIGWSQFGLGRFDDACRSFRHAIDLGGEDLATRLDNALGLLAGGRGELALHEYHHALDSVEGGDPEQTRCELGVALREFTEARAAGVIGDAPEVDEAQRTLSAAIAALPAAKAPSGPV